MTPKVNGEVTFSVAPNTLQGSRTPNGNHKTCGSAKIMGAGGLETSDSRRS